jgi:mRNA interferase MazF
MRGFGSEVAVPADDHNGLGADSAAQCQHIGVVSVDRDEVVKGNVGAATLSEIRGVLGLMLDIN